MGNSVAEHSGGAITDQGKPGPIYGECLKLRQVHFSEIDAQGHHHGATLATTLASAKIVDLITDNVPVIIESQISSDEIPKELAAVGEAFKRPGDPDVERVSIDWGALA